MMEKGPKFKILVTEDEAVTALDLEFRMGRLGYTVIGPCASGEEALALAEKERPDLALMDIQLAGPMDGVSVAKHLMDQLLIPSVFLTAHVSETILKQAKESRAALGYIVKPYSDLGLSATLEMAVATILAERRARASEDLLRAFEADLSAASLGVLIVSFGAWHVLQVDFKAAEMLGYSQDNLRKMCLPDLLPDGCKPELEELMAPMRDRSRVSHAFKTKFRRGDGNDFPAEVTVRQSGMSHGNPYLVVSVTDISSRGACETGSSLPSVEGLTESRDILGGWNRSPFFQELIQLVISETSENFILERASDLIATFLEAVFVDIWMVPIGGGNLEMQARGAHGKREDRRDPDAFIGEVDVRQVAQSRKPSVAQTVFLDKHAMAQGTDTKSEQELIFYGYPLFVNSVLAGVLALYFRGAKQVDTKLLEELSELMALSIREKRRQQRRLEAAEERLADSYENLKRILDGSKDAVLILDEGGVVKFSNSAAVQLFSKRIERGDHFGLFLTGEDFEELDLPQSDGSIWTVEAQCGKTQWFGDRGFIVTFRDVTERKRITTELQKARDAAIHAARAKNEFLATMSHELRTPLNGILGMTYLLKDSESDLTKQEYLNIIEKSGMALLSMIEDLLDISKLEALQMQLVQNSFELRPLIDRIVETAKAEIHDRPLSVRLEFDRAVPSRLLGDEARLRQVLMNLTDNAVKFSDLGSVIVSVQLLTKQDGKVRIRFKVTDTGIGIPRKKQEMIFAPFQQGDSSSSRRHGGSGLGLAISHQLVGMMGGHLKVTSEVGKGSDFWFDISLSIVQDAGIE